MLAPYELARRFGPGMRERGWGNIINVVSGSGLLPTKGLLPYGVSKAALWMMTRYLASELAPAIRVNALCPGIVVAPDAAPDPSAASVLPLIPMGRTGHPDEIVGAAVYLASDASSYTTGSLLVCNGGRPWLAAATAWSIHSGVIRATEDGERSLTHIDITRRDRRSAAEYRLARS